ncbi:hypothetical protein P170DRAFT_512440 [Aspergillus steynii IBT 23096]|uniref:Uncharacterized protein n=1 Tax=Aspergillus steynii IBT 23096 TaxID=1392250 RepID=A0A2I2FYW2_9EURO|nr:uncharacterized protein P170DRAFT_512440 [Aspergillus steynii IBT 23096]PLB45819.1 hypothetical protein P170DRAFT_512440 [Aspergillus steynii IBT 23096]
MSEYYSSTSSSSFYSSSSGSNTNGQESGYRTATSSHTAPDGSTVVRSAEQDLGGPAVFEERRFDGDGRERLVGDSTTGHGGAGARRIENVDDEEQ